MMTDVRMLENGLKLKLTHGNANNTFEVKSNRYLHLNYNTQICGHVHTYAVKVY